MLGIGVSITSGDLVKTCCKTVSWNKFIGTKASIGPGKVEQVGTNGRVGNTEVDTHIIIIGIGRPEIHFHGVIGGIENGIVETGQFIVVYPPDDLVGIDKFPSLRVIAPTGPIVKDCSRIL